MKVYLLAPRTDLSYVDAEVDAWLRGDLDVTTRRGDVRQIDVLTDITTGEYEFFSYLGHATKDGWLLSDGLLSSSLITSLMRGHFPEGVFLNTCDSQDTAEMIQRNTELQIIATVREVPDKEAYQTGALFAYWLSRTGDVATAFRNSRPGDDPTYIHLAGTKKK